MASTLQLRLHEVYALDETGGGGAAEWGDDDIYLGGVTVARDFSGGVQVERIPYFSVGDFNDGTRRKYAPH